MNSFLSFQQQKLLLYVVVVVVHRPVVRWQNKILCSVFVVGNFMFNLRKKRQKKMTEQKKAREIKKENESSFIFCIIHRKRERERKKEYRPFAMHGYYS